MEPNETPFVADTDGAFLALRADTRAEIRDAELIFRAVLIKMFEQIRPLLRPELAAVDLQPIAMETPAEFIRGMLPFFQGYSEMLDQGEALQMTLRRSQGSSLN
jgi:hypothetical protein